MAEYFENPQTIYWLIVGIIFIFIEVLVLPGVGLISAGLSAITMGALIAFNLLNSESLLTNIAYFLFFTVMWWVIIWRPLLKSIKAKSTDYNSFKGTNAIVDDENGIIAGKIGYVKWSGTRMRARLSPNSKIDKINNNETIWVIENKNGILIVDVMEPSH